MAAPRLLVDEMLKGLVKWLRAAGYDTADEAEGVADNILLDRALEEDRLLITQDRALAERAPAGRVLLLECGDNSDCAARLSHDLGINWLYRPFSRCLVCNTPLQAATKEQRHQVPEDIQQQGGEILYCPACNRIYWDGGHVARMRHHLRHWAEQFNPRQSAE